MSTPSLLIHLNCPLEKWGRKPCSHPPCCSWLLSYHDAICIPTPCNPLATPWMSPGCPLEGSVLSHLLLGALGSYLVMMPSAAQPPSFAPPLPQLGNSLAIHWLSPEHPQHPCRPQTWQSFFTPTGLHSTPSVAAPLQSLPKLLSSGSHSFSPAAITPHR